MSTLTPAQILEDLSQFQQLLEGRFAYLYNGQPDYRTALEALRDRVETCRTQGAFGFELQKILAMFIDGHAQVNRIGLAKGHLPFLLEAVGERVIATLPDRSAFAVDAHPYLEAIDGLELTSWLNLSASVVPQGSPQLRRYRSLRLLQNLQHWRAAAGLPQENSVRLDFASEAGSRVRRTISLTETAPHYGEWPRNASRSLPSDTVYLRLARMKDGLEAEIQRSLDQLKRARGFVIDLRGNSGGTRQALLHLAPSLMAERDVPSVASVAAYRLHPEVGEAHLASRAMYRQDDDRWSERERSAIRSFRASFRPEFEPPPGCFSDWHFLVLAKNARTPSPGTRPPIVVLLDVACFSATDIFLGALKGISGVTLVGEASSGGSGLPLLYELKNSGLKLRLSSMLSYQPSGALYDTNGVQPDIALEPTPTDFLTGGTDTALEWVLENGFAG